VYRTETGSPSAAGHEDPQFALNADGTLVVSLHHYADVGRFAAGSVAQFGKIAAALPAAKAVVFDLRADAPVSDDAAIYLANLLQSSGIQDLLTGDGTAAPSLRERSFDGFPDETQFDGIYSSALNIVQPMAMISETVQQVNLPVVFVLNGDTPVPSLAITERLAGRAVFVAQGAPGDGAAAPQARLDAGDGVSVRLRLADVVAPNGMPGVNVDYRVADTPGNAASAPALQLAERLVQPGAVRRLARSAPLPGQLPQPIFAYDYSHTYPDLGHRLVAAFKSYAAVNFFFPYTNLMNDDWDAALSEAVDGVTAATDALSYETAVAHMYTHINDSHSFPWGPAIRNADQGQPPPIVTKLIGTQLVIVRILDPAATQAGAAVGDVIDSINGESVSSRITRLSQVLPASTPQGLNAKLEDKLDEVASGNSETLALEKADGSHKTVQLPLDTGYFTHRYDATTGPVYSVQANNIGYVDLSRLTIDQIPDLESQLQNTRAIVFDMRGYPYSTEQTLAQWIGKRAGTYAHFTRRRLNALDFFEEPGAALTLSFDQALPPLQATRYTGKTYLLIDETTISQAEHTGLLFRAAADTVFVGSPTVGADGDITYIALPGGMMSSFTGEAVALPDGTQLQRKGLQPDIAVAPTLAGIRAGKDEVLDAALAAALHDTGG
jgi:C-terminal processing protease CtpA/Prc